MPGDKEYTVRAWHGHPSFRGLTTDEWDDLDDAVNDVCAYFHCSRAECDRRIFARGLESYQEEMEEKGVLTPDAKINMRLSKNRKAKRRKKRVVELYEQEGMEAVDWAQKEGIIDNVEEILTEHSILIPDKSWAERAKEWLRVLLISGKMQTSNIFQMAIADELIYDNIKDKNRLSQLAKREGFTTGEYGVWALPEVVARI